MKNNRYLLPIGLFLAGIVISMAIDERIGGLLAGVGIVGALYIWTNRRR